ncbi:uncharacterized protein LOC118478528 [Aplysia californica]|uniref:Uncharacterized protein LOC118478528 n=1 Tax=Aplysia californica TaxID=6500 RepID=A0ABM1W0M1_APLCA|nr:uncharacterized protein LOC118478528 [Aplysia californica]
MMENPPQSKADFDSFIDSKFSVPLNSPTFKTCFVNGNIVWLYKELKNFQSVVDFLQKHSNREILANPSSMRFVVRKCVMKVKCWRTNLKKHWIEMHTFLQTDVVARLPQKRETSSQETSVPDSHLDELHSAVPLVSVPLMQSTPVTAAPPFLPQTEVFLDHAYAVTPSTVTMTSQSPQYLLQSVPSTFLVQSSPSTPRPVSPAPIQSSPSTLPQPVSSAPSVQSFPSTLHQPLSSAPIQSFPSTFVSPVIATAFHQDDLPDLTPKSRHACGSCSNSKQSLSEQVAKNKILKKAFIAEKRKKIDMRKQYNVGRVNQTFARNKERIDKYRDTIACLKIDISQLTKEVENLNKQNKNLEQKLSEQAKVANKAKKEQDTLTRKVIKLEEALKEQYQDLKRDKKYI